MECDDLHTQKIIQTTESYEDTMERFNCSPNRYAVHPTNTPNHFLATLTNATPFFPSTTSQPRTSPTDPERRARQVGQSLHRVAVELTVVVVVVVARPCCGRCRCRVLDAPPALLVTPPNTYPPRNSRSAGCVEWSRKTSRNCRSSADQSPPPPSASPETPAKTQTNPWVKLPAETHGTIGVPQSVAFPEAFQRHVERFHGREIQI